MPESPLRAPQNSITDLRAHAVREPAGGRSYVVVMVVTDAGISGLGEAAPVPDALAGQGDGTVGAAHM